MEKNQWINMLRQDVVPALGCTEPVCVALCAAYAAQQLSGEICTESPEQCIRNMARIGTRGMERTDSEILAIMTEKSK